VPALKAGLGKYLSNPLTGYLMILRTRGRKSGEMRDAPLGYTVIGDHVYCMAGFGRKTHWFQNVLADPRVEVILPSRAFSGIAQEVTDEAGTPARAAATAAEHGRDRRSHRPWATSGKMSPEEASAKCEGLPLVRIQAPESRRDRTIRAGGSGRPDRAFPQSDCCGFCGRRRRRRVALPTPRGLPADREHPAAQTASRGGRWIG